MGRTRRVENIVLGEHRVGLSLRKQKKQAGIDHRLKEFQQLKSFLDIILNNKVLGINIKKTRIFGLFFQISLFNLK